MIPEQLIRFLMQNGLLSAPKQETNPLSLYVNPVQTNPNLKPSEQEMARRKGTIITTGVRG